MLFRKKMPRSCCYCVYATALSEEELLCSKRGIVGVDHKCRKFRYDPCKRIPPRQKSPDFDQFSKEDFTL